MSKTKYTELKDFNETTDYDFYGIIYDSTFPTREDDTDTSNFICAIKILGPGLNWLTHPTSFQEEAIHIIIKSNNVENLPHPKSVGNIIRIHRGVYRPKKRKNIYLNFNNNIMKSSWVLFNSKIFLIF